MKKICIIGHARHGKDTCAEIFKNNFPVKFDSTSTSYFCCKLFLFDLLKDKYGYQTIDECFNDRVNHRQEWYEEIKNHIKDDKSFITKEILKHNDIYVGIRDIEEFNASKHLFDLTIWVDASLRCEPESNKSCTVTKDCAHIIIENNTTLENFESKVYRLGKILFPKEKIVDIIPICIQSMKNIEINSNGHYQLIEGATEGIIITKPIKLGIDINELEIAINNINKY